MRGTHSLGPFMTRDIVKNYLKVIFILCPLVTVLFIFGFGTTEHLLQRFAVSMAIAITVTSCCFLGSFFLNSIYRYYRTQRGFAPRKKLLWTVLTSFPFLFPGLHLGFLVADRLSLALGYHWKAPDFSDYSSGIVFGILVSGLFTFLEVIRESKDSKHAAEIQLSRLETENLRAQVSALTAQMNPHLLFNSLNTIASTIATDPASAEEMVIQLSELYRGVLKAARGDSHSLQAELELCRSYLAIEKKRFGARLIYQIAIETKIDPKRIQIPVLLLQPIVENAVKHGISPKREGGKIDVTVRQDAELFSLEVTDDGNGKTDASSTQTSGTGTGLSNCRSRIQLKHGENAKLSFDRTQNGLTRVSIQIPSKEVII